MANGRGRERDEAAEWYVRQKLAEAREQADGYAPSKGSIHAVEARARRWARENPDAVLEDFRAAHGSGTDGGLRVIK